MNLEEIVNRTKCLEICVGSNLYGTATPKSDVDFSGIFVAPKEFYLGLSTVQEVDLSVVSKRENGRNDEDAVDRKFYELRKFIKLASQNNPNIIEHLFCPDDKTVFKNAIGEKLLSQSHLFPHKGIYDKFIGYAFSQKKKMMIKSDNMNDIVAGIELLKSFDPKQYVVECIDGKSTKIKTLKDTGQHFRIGDMSIQKNDTIKQALRKMTDRMDKFSGRYDDFVSKYGYDTKFASHLIRLLYEGIELLETGTLKFPINQADLILSIKDGSFKVEEIIEMADDLEHRIDRAYSESELPSKPRYKEIEILLMELIEESWENNK